MSYSMTLGYIFAYRLPKPSKNHCFFHYPAMRFRDFGKTVKTIAKTSNPDTGKHRCRNLIKPDEFNDILSNFRKMARKRTKKPLGFSVGPAWESADAENLVKPVEN